jgi:hypothetical protein
VLVIHAGVGLEMSMLGCRCRCWAICVGIGSYMLAVPVHKCTSFYRYRSRVGYNPQVSKPVQIKARVYIKSDCNVEKNYLMSR